MNDWTKLLHKTELSDTELRSIPGVRSDSLITNLEYLTKRYGLSMNDLLENVLASYDIISRPANWISPVDDLQIIQNLSKYSEEFITHHDYLEVGKNFHFASQSWLGHFYRLIPAGVILKQIAQSMPRFNNYYTGRNLYQKKNESYIALEYYPYFAKVATGTECQFNHGVFHYNFALHHIHNYNSSQEFCGVKVKDILRNFYSQQNMQYHEEGRSVFIDNEEVARKVRLKSMRKGRAEIFTKETDHKHPVPNAIQFIKDVIIHNRKIFSVGEIYNAPYCLLSLKWENPRFFDQIYYFFSSFITDIETELETNAVIKGDSDSFDFNKQPMDRQLVIVFTVHNPDKLRVRLEMNRSENFLDYLMDRLYIQVKRNNGIVKHLSENSFMAKLQEAEEAFSCAMDLKNTIHRLNLERITKGFEKIHFGMGMNRSIYPDNNKKNRNALDMERDMVARDMAKFTKVISTELLCTEEIFELYKNNDSIRFLCDLNLYSDIPDLGIKIYEIFDSDPPHIQQLKRKLAPFFAQAYDDLNNGELDEALLLMDKIGKEIPPHSHYPDAKADLYYDVFYKHCKKLKG